MMAKGKMKSVYGIYKKHGREAFLDAAEYYSCHVNPNSIEKTIDEMESRWYDRSHTMTEAEKMVEDYNNGKGNCTTEKNLLIFFLENYKNLIVEIIPFRQGTTASKSRQVPPVITESEREYTHLKSYYNRRKTDRYSYKG